MLFLWKKYLHLKNAILINRIYATAILVYEFVQFDYVLVWCGKSDI